MILSAPGEVALEEIRIDEPGPGEVSVRIDATGVCHSDLNAVDGTSRMLEFLDRYLKRPAGGN